MKSDLIETYIIMGTPTIMKITSGLIMVCFLYSCTNNGPEIEFIADDSTFSNFTSWQLEKTYHGPDPLLQLFAHLDNDSTVVRNVYFKDGQDPVGGKYPTGTLVVKNSFNSSNTINEFVAMAKRGNGFNPQANNWEFFLLNPDGTIAKIDGDPVRGTNIMNGICYNCHSAVSNKDFIYSK